jgi:hypothetical protein
MTYVAIILNPFIAQSLPVNANNAISIQSCTTSILKRLRCCVTKTNILQSPRMMMFLLSVSHNNIMRLQVTVCYFYYLEYRR